MKITEVCDSACYHDNQCSRKVDIITVIIITGVLGEGDELRAGEKRTGEKEVNIIAPNANSQTQAMTRSWLGDVVVRVSDL